MSLTRRHALAGLLALGLGNGAAARALEVSTRPRLRGSKRLVRPAEAVTDAILERSGLAGHSGFALYDLGAGRVLEGHRAAIGQPPASVTKALTALYGLQTLGPGHAFRTRVAISGPVVNGRADALYLIGGGDPHLDTDGLAMLAEAVAKAGIHGVNRGAFVVSGALPYHRHIDPDQPIFVGYNPSISGMNLNFNRVHFDWKPTAAGDWNIRLSARTRRFDPEVRSVEMLISDRKGPVFDYRMAEGRDLWSVREDALGKGGARWLPVRSPAIYAGEVFRAVGAQYGLRLPDLREVETAPADLSVVAEMDSAALEPMLRAMLKYSTNLTAEVIGLKASLARGGKPGHIAMSSAEMTSWLQEAYGLRSADFRNHSGLTDASRLSAVEMVQLLGRAGPTRLPPLLKEIPVYDTDGAAVSGAVVNAKTGTLNFTRGLAGYLQGSNGRRLAFAIFAADLERRAQAGKAERPRGARGWANRAKVQEQALLRHWIGRYCTG